jgi:glycosyltransferase involved in cell wall biosynthesis/ribosomal protein S18 acetylase RimI-like enzyme
MISPRVAHVTVVDLSLRFLLLPQMQALRDAGFEVTAISAPGPWVPEIEAEGIGHIPWPHATRAWDPRADALAFRELLSIFRHERFDVVHTHTPKPGLIGRLAARLADVPCVLNTVHGLYTTPQDRLRRRAPVLAAEWVASRFSDLELYQSAEDLAWARRLHVTRPLRSILLGNGIDLSRFAPEHAGMERIRKLRAELGFGQDELIVGTVGRMVLEKGYAELFSAAAMVRAKLPNARFLSVGQSDPDKPDAVTAEAIELARDDFIFTGWREDVADLMAMMDVFVLPSWREGLPRSAIEAAAAGLPLVLTDIRGCREVVDEGVEGILVPVRDPVRLAQAIVRLLEEPDLRSRMGSAARVKAEARFDERRVAKIVVDATRTLLAAAGRLPVEGEGGVHLRRARASDAADMAGLHRRSMPTAFLPLLGSRFLKRLYRSMARDPDAVVLVAEDRDRVVGFATAVPSVHSFYRKFARSDGVMAAIAAAPHLARPQVLLRAIETARYPSRTNGLPDAELLSIAVDESRRFSGVGSALAHAVARGLADRGVREFKVIVGAESEGANRFYERLGCQPAGQASVHEGKPSNVWLMTCLS